MSELFEIEESLSPRKKWERKHDIATHFSDADPPWIAVSMKVCRHVLKGYSLTKEQETNIGALFAGYCNRLDDMGLIGYGDTRDKAIDDLIELGVIPAMEAER
jgi:hypothetical protein